MLLLIIRRCLLPKAENMRLVTDGMIHERKGESMNQSTGNSESGMLQMMVKTKLFLALLSVCMIVSVLALPRTSITANAATNEETIFSVLTQEYGYNNAAGAALLANIKRESSFNPTNTSKPSGVSYGLCQWTGSRRTRLQNWCKENGFDYTTIQGQIAYLDYEMKTYYKSVYNYLRDLPNTAQGAYDGAYYFSMNFEKPAGGTRSAAARGAIARDTYWPKYKSTSVSKSGWVQKDSSWYYYVDNAAVTGWREIDGKWYYFNGSGVMQTGWLKYNNNWFYLSKVKDGHMLTGWANIDGKKYYFNSSGVMRTGWLQENGSWYFLSRNGALRTGWAKVNGSWYYMNQSGAMQTGWQKIDGSWYYLSGSGAMRTGWQKISGSWYYLSENGVMKTGWQKIGGSWYYLSGNGTMKTGWIKINGSWYYLSGSGVMQTGTQTIDGVSYTFSGSGIMQ